MTSAYFGLVALVLLAIAQTGVAQSQYGNNEYDQRNGNGRTSLRCWTCSTDTYGDICGDPFNYTKYHEFSNNYQNVNNNGYQGQNQYNRNNVPRMEICTAGFGQQAMCKKTVMRTGYGDKKIISRECSPVSTRQSVGACPVEATGRSLTIDFCEYCNEDGCNSSSTLSTNVLLAAIIPCFLVYFFRK